MWVLFVGTTILGFSEKEVGHWTYKKWGKLSDYYKRFYNFKTKKMLYELEPTEEVQMESLEWFND